MSMVVGRSSDSKEIALYGLRDMVQERREKGLIVGHQRYVVVIFEFFPMTVNLSTASLCFPMFSNLGIQQP
jgi:hypothetical protein